MGHLRDETIGYTVAERDEGHDDERGQDVADISPVDLCDLSDHHAADLHIMLAVIRYLKKEYKLPESECNQLPKVVQRQRWAQRTPQR